MSSYVSFYIKANEKQYLPIGSFSRNNAEYEYINDILPYGKVIPLTQAKLEMVLSIIKEENNNYDKSIQKYLNEKEFICKMNNSVEEKREALLDIDSLIENVKDIYEALERAYGWYRSLLIILDDVDYNKNIDKNEYIYVGIDASPNGED